jgi:predicted O-linked N-acetylglucosamine transferase (SPINDLY family)
MGDPQITALVQQGKILHQQGRLKEAQSIYEQGLRLDPNYFELLFLMGTVLINQCRDYLQAVDFLSKAIHINSLSVAAYSNRSMAFLALGNLEKSLVDCNKAIELEPDFEAAYINQGNVLLQLNRVEESLESYKHALLYNPLNPHILYNQGVLLHKLGYLDKALKSYDQAIKIDSNYAEAFANRGEVLFLLKRFDDALLSLDKSIEINPGISIAHSNRGAVLQKLGHLNDALESYEKAIKISPNYALAFSNKGALLQTLNRLDEAKSSLDTAIYLDPNHPGTYFNRGNVYKESNEFFLALQDYEMAYRIQPDDIHSLSMIIHLKMMLCDWTNFDELERMANAVNQIQPFALLAISNSEGHIKNCTVQYSEYFYPAQPPLTLHKPKKYGSKIKIGYVSGEFRHQATGILVAELIELHDKNKFDIVGFDTGWDDHSEIRMRLNLAFDEIINISNLPDIDAAKIIAENEIDILVNLNGYFGKITQGIFCYRPSPVQINYLGFPGTLGSKSIDYIIADRITIPEASRIHYSEKVAYLPNSYQANDRKRSISRELISRSKMGLPEDSFVFCCFNNSYKITPTVFDSWMRILKNVDHSVLWLLGGSEEMRHNLCKETILRGVDPQRLIFAERMNLPDHLNRHRLANLFLDTSPCNAHTTASDALWAGLPVLTYSGSTFSGRVCASLLDAIGLPELIATSILDYENRAITLGNNREELQLLTQKLCDNRLKTPLFDTENYCIHIENAYKVMFDRYTHGLDPDHILNLIF